MSKERIGSIKDYTPNFKMIIPRFDLATWHDYIEENFRNIDALFFNLFGINNYSGSWKQITEYTQGQVLFIGDDFDINGNVTEFSGRLVKVLVDHVTDNSDYFNIFYNLHPEYYELFADASTAQVYANLSRDWANKTDGTIITPQGVDTGEYSSKKYAQDAQNSLNTTNTYKEEAKNYATNAQNSSTISQNQATIATNSANSARNSQTSAQNSANLAKTYADAALSDANDAKNSAELSKQYANDKINQTHITNCIIEIPQDIKLELNNGTLTLKAGSKVYDGNGLFAEITNDISNPTPTVNSQVVVMVANGVLCTAFMGESVTELPANASTYKIFYNTTDKKCYFDIPSGWIPCSFPIALVTGTTTNWTSIDQTFNGFGYIGSTVFALPGVKGLIPNGRNADGTLKNTEFTLNKVVLGTYANTLTTSGEVMLVGDNQGNITRIDYKNVYGKDYWHYEEAENKWYFAKDQKTWAEVGSAKWSSGAITSFTPKLPFRAVDQNDFNKLDGEVAKLDEANTFSKVQTMLGKELFFKTNEYSAAEAPSQTINYGQINIYDKNSQFLGGLSHYQYPSGTRETLMRCRNLNGNVYQISINSSGKTQAPTPDANSNTTEIATTAWVTSNGTKNSFKPNWAGKVSVAVATNYTAPSNGFMSFRCSSWNRTPILTINSVDIFSTSGNSIAGFFGSVPVCKGDIINLSGDNEAVIYFIPFK